MEGFGWGEWRWAWFPWVGRTGRRGEDSNWSLDFHTLLAVSVFSNGMYSFRVVLRWSYSFLLAIPSLFLSPFSAPHKLNLILTFFLLLVLWQKSDMDSTNVSERSDRRNGRRMWYVGFFFTLSAKERYSCSSSPMGWRYVKDILNRIFFSRKLCRNVQ